MNMLADTIAAIRGQDTRVRARARQHLDQLAMPHWALGRVMDLALDLAGATGSIRPSMQRKAIVVMVGDHGVVAQGISKFPQDVTRQMVHNFIHGGAGVNALARQVNARVFVVDMGVASDLSSLDEQSLIISERVAPGTADLSQGPAMSREQAIASLEAGIRIAERLATELDVFGTGDMGIGNTTPSAAIVATLTGRPVSEVTGRGAGIEKAQLTHKVSIIERALEVNAPQREDPIDVLAKVGGFEIGGIAGLCLGAAALQKPIVIDGIISTAGALIAHALEPKAAELMIAGHQSTEPGHRFALQALGKRPLLNLELRLGEGTGAALAMHIVEAASRVLTEVATFEEAAVSQANR